MSYGPDLLSVAAGDGTAFCRGLVAKDDGLHGALPLESLPAGAVTSSVPSPISGRAPQTQRWHLRPPCCRQQESCQAPTRSGRLTSAVWEEDRRAEAERGLALGRPCCSVLLGVSCPFPGRDHVSSLRSSHAQPRPSSQLAHRKWWW